MARWVAYIGDAGLLLILAGRAFADFLFRQQALGRVGLRLQELYLLVASALGGHRALFQSIIIAVFIAMSLGGHFAWERQNRSRSC